MTTPKITRRSLLAGTHGISGPAIVIDTFRAFTTAAFLLDRGVDRIVLAETLDEARERSISIANSILCGEEGGRRPDDFDLATLLLQPSTTTVSKASPSSCERRPERAASSVP